MNEQKASILDVRNPQGNFLERMDYKEIKTEQSQKTTLSILHLYGIPGSGKTEIVRQLATDFPYDSDESIMVIKEFDFSDSTEILQIRFEDFLKQMLDNNLIEGTTAYRSACSSLENGNTKSSVKLLHDANIPILIIIHDPLKQDQSLLDDLVSSLKNVASSKTTNPIHLYVTSNSRRTLRNLTKLEKHEIRGVTLEEGLRLLDAESDIDDDEKEAAAEIWKYLSGSPLGLAAVESHCKTSSITYNDYLDLIADSSYTRLTYAYGTKHKHVLDAVIRLLDTKEGFFGKMKTIAMFHHTDIPRQLFEKIMQRRRKEAESEKLAATLSRNKQEAGIFISQLEDFSICEVKKDGKKLISVTFHRVVFSAIQAILESQQTSQIAQHLREAILSISSMVSKDFRKRDDWQFTKSMRPHIQAVLANSEKYQEQISGDFTVTMALAHLREVLGASISAKAQKAAEECLQKSAKMIWDEVVVRSSTDVAFDVFIEKQQDPVENYASQIVSACTEAGNMLLESDDEIIRYLSVVLLLKEEDTNFICKLISDKKFADQLKFASKYGLGVSTTTVEQLREEDVFLNEVKHYSVFFLDRLISNIYSLGRVMIYDDKDVSTQRREKFMWIADLVHALCVECKAVTGVSLLFQQLTVWLKSDIRLKRSEHLEKQTKKYFFLETRDIVRKNARQSTKEDEMVYENGLLKCGAKNCEYDEIRRWKALVRTNTKLWPLLTSDERAAYEKEADGNCKALYNKASETKDRWNPSPKCIVYCGKYFAAKGDYEQAAKYFSEALETRVIKDDSSKSFPWTCYNYAWTVCEGNLHSHGEDAIRFCQEALQFKKDICNRLLEKLEQQVEVLHRLPYLKRRRFSKSR